MSTPSLSPSPSATTVIDAAGQFAGTPVGSTVVGGLILAFLLWLIGRVSKRHPFRAIGRGVRAAAIGAAKAVRWIRGLRVASKRRWQARYDEGFAARSAEIAEERSWSPAPSFRLETERNGARFYWFWNWGATVREVRLSADPDLFTFDQEPYWPGEVTPNVGTQVHGGVTERGRAEGVWFSATWRDVHGDEQRGTFELPPGERVYRNHQEAYERGRREERDEFDRQLRTAPDPRWLISTDEEWDDFYLENLVALSKARNVRVDPASTNFRMLTAGTWDPVDGGMRVVFRGDVLTEYTGDVRFEVRWTGIDGKVRTDYVTPREV